MDIKLFKKKEVINKGKKNEAGADVWYYLKSDAYNMWLSKDAGKKDDQIRISGYYPLTAWGLKQLMEVNATRSLMGTDATTRKELKDKLEGIVKLMDKYVKAVSEQADEILRIIEEGKRNV